MTHLPEIKIGDRITFRAFCRRSTKTETRTVVGFSCVGWPEVRYAGYSNFIVYPSEIKAINAKQSPAPCSEED